MNLSLKCFSEPRLELKSLMYASSVYAKAEKHLEKCYKPMECLACYNENPQKVSLYCMFPSESLFSAFTTSI